MSKDDGGPAFPFGYTDKDGANWRCDGMSLRDYFAAAAINLVLRDEWLTDEKMSVIAEYSYKIADAMLAERAK
jgi:hypothetical protein